VKRFVLVTAAMLPMMLSLPVLADAESEQTTKNLCAGCHGPDGISTNPLWPNLAGQNAEYTAKQLRAYRDGTRSDLNMNSLMKPFSDADIEALAAHYAAMANED
jgi:cytochrome c553